MAVPPMVWMRSGGYQIVGSCSGRLFAGRIDLRVKATAFAVRVFHVTQQTLPDPAVVCLLLVGLACCFVPAAQSADGEQAAFPESWLAETPAQASAVEPVKNQDAQGGPSVSLAPPVQQQPVPAAPVVGISAERQAQAPPIQRIEPAATQPQLAQPSQEAAIPAAPRTEPVSAAQSAENLPRTVVTVPDSTDNVRRIEPDSQTASAQLTAGAVSQSMERTSRPSQQPRPLFYCRVQENETLSDIADRCNVSLSRMAAGNELGRDAALEGGQRLWIPDRPGVYHRVKEGETLASLVRQLGANYRQVLDYYRCNTEQANQELDAGKSVFVPLPEFPVSSLGSSQRLEPNWAWPLQDVKILVSSPFGPRVDPFRGADAGGEAGKLKMHTGVDFSCPIGTNVVAARSGEVSFSGWKNGYGNTVIVDHADGTSSLYGHLDTRLVTEGDQVHQGQRLARSGNTGRTTGPHLHFEIEQPDGNRVNPLALLPSMPPVPLAEAAASSAQGVH
jgi:murein DD-endopeptidase MepM/ murein hydrolase activator NlpD